MKKLTIELLKENRKALQFLHTAAGFDFESDYFIAKLEEKFTYNSVINAVKPYFNSNYKIALLVSPVVGCCKSGLYYAVVRDGKIDGTRQNNISYWGADMNCCWGVGDFEELRKKYTDHVYIIVQNTAFTNIPEPAQIDFNARYTVKGVTKATDQNRSCVWSNEITLVATDGTGREFSYKPFDIGRHKETRSDILTDYIDKSGFIIRQRRQQLQNAAAKLRADREKTAADTANYDVKTLELSKQIESARSFLAAAFADAASYNLMRAISKKIDSFAWVLFEYELYIKRLNNKEYTSVARIESDINGIKTKLFGIMEVQP